MTPPVSGMKNEELSLAASSAGSPRKNWWGLEKR